MAGVPFSEVQDKIKGMVDQQIQASIAPLQETNQRLERTIEDAMTHRTAVIERKPLAPGVPFARFLMSVAAKKLGYEPAEFARKRWGDDGFSESLAMGTNVASEGGYMVPKVISADFIDLLRPKNAVMSRVGADNIVQMDSGNLSIPKQTGGATSSYVGENQSSNASKPTLGQVNLTFKQLRCIVAISNSMIRYASPNAENFVRRDAIMSMANRADLAFIAGTGLSNTPKGLVNWAGNTTPQTGVTLATIETDYTALVGFLEDANVGLFNPGWIMHPQTLRGLKKIRTTNGPYAYRDEIVEAGTFMGYPFSTTTQVASAATVIFADFADVVIGESTRVMVDTSSEAAYHDENGTLVSAFDMDQTIVRVIVEHDIAVRHAQSVATLTSVTLS